MCRKGSSSHDFTGASVKIFLISSVVTGENGVSGVPSNITSALNIVYAFCCLTKLTSALRLYTRATPPPFVVLYVIHDVCRIQMESFPQLQLCLSEPSHVSVMASKSTWLDTMKSVIDVVLFLIDLLLRVHKVKCLLRLVAFGIRTKFWYSIVLVFSVFGGRFVINVGI
jgi:hypothetical protein